MVTRQHLHGLGYRRAAEQGDALAHKYFGILQRAGRAVSSQRRRSGPLKRSARDAAGGSPSLVDLDRGAGSPSGKCGSPPQVSSTSGVSPGVSPAWAFGENVGRRPRFLPPRGFRCLAAARRGLRDPLLHSATAPPPLPGYRASRARPPLPALSRSRHSIVLTVFGGRLLNARAKTVSTLATTISPSCRQTTDAIRNLLPDPAPQPERTRPSVRLPLVQPVADLAVQDRAGRRCRPARSCGHRSDAATRRGGHTNPGGVRPAGIASIEAFPSTVGWGQMRAEVGVNHGINAQAANGSSARGSQLRLPRSRGRVNACGLTS